MIRPAVICLSLGLALGIQSCDSQSETSSSTKSATPEDTAKTTVVSKRPDLAVEVTPIDTNETYLAYLLAGMMPEDSNALGGLFLSPEWKKYRDGIDPDWIKVEEQRLARLRQWEQEELSAQLDPKHPLFYPFSGPDFLHAFSFYPNASQYFFIAIEDVFAIPDVTDQSKPELKRFLASMDFSFRDILTKSYFITTHMMADLVEDKADGVLPLFYAFIARTGHEIIGVYPVEVNTNGVIYKHDSLTYQENQAVQFKIRRKGEEQVKTLTYFNRSISDRDLKRYHPEFITFLDQRVPKCNTFVKAASYLMHYEGFSIVRDAVLKHSDCIFQDDTGVPLRYVDLDQWNLRLYGDYTRPIKDFSDRMYQSDLNELYDRTAQDQKYELPFSLGYHIVGDRIQNHQIFTRK